MTSMRRRYVASTSLRCHVPTMNLAPPLKSPPHQYSKPWPPNILNLPTPMTMKWILPIQDYSKSCNFAVSCVLHSLSCSLSIVLLNFSDTNLRQPIWNLNVQFAYASSDIQTEEVAIPPSAVSIKHLPGY